MKILRPEVTKILRILLKKFYLIDKDSKIDRKMKIANNEKNLYLLKKGKYLTENSRGK
jgi:hypothetical protein